MPPTKLSSWDGMRMAVTYGAQSPQDTSRGGGFMAGASAVEDAYDGENLARSVNHRLNVMGFLDLSAYCDEYKYSGNLGMLDISVRRRSENLNPNGHA